MRSFTFLTCATAILLLTTTTVLAQQPIAKSNKTILSAPDATNLTPLNAAATSAIIQPNAKVADRLINLFPKASTLEWRQFNHLYHVSLLNAGRKSVAVLTPKGLINYILVDCQLSQLPQDFQKKIARDYAGYTFVSAVQIHAHHTVAHQVILENADGYITLKSTEDGVEEIQAIKKNGTE